ncbi:hypothetical protein [Streptomyces hokutonensis]|uniref:hypothetical protein n=1 Tax=Streptomyces hokutonensis TaxID=1306990 RepID=UPI00381D42D8
MLAGILAIPAAVLALSSTAAAIPMQTGNSQVQASSKATLLTPAPNCITFTQYKHFDWVYGYYTNVYLDNNCGSPQRVKVVMANGNDSGCLQLPAGKIDYIFQSETNNGLQPYVDRIDAC